MLFTRCPDCGTTFRVTDDALTKANGQVRCGRCASVFNAYAELREQPADAAPPQVDAENPDAEAAGRESTPRDPEAAVGAPQQGPGEPETEIPAPQQVSHESEVAVGQSKAPESSPFGALFGPGAPVAGAAPSAGEQSPAAQRFNVFTVADVVAQVGLVADEDAETGELRPDAGALANAGSMSAEQVIRVLDDGPVPTPAPWPLAERARGRSRWWSVAAFVAVAVLGVQAVHHFRADLVRHAVIGPIVQDAYAMLGTRVVPRVDIHEYRILDWVATAQPNVRGQGSLKITARIQNRAPQPQPFPSVQVQLKDRWEAAVGRRVFAPMEYGAHAKELMAPGETTRAEIEVVDPGQDAYGFELDVCIEVETDVISCGADKVFL